MIHNEQHISGEHPDSPRLSPADAAALDRLIESGTHPDPGDARQARIADLLALLGTPVAAESDRSTRVSLTQVRARRAALAEAQTDHPAEPLRLSPADAEALDRWMESPATTGDPRVERHDALARLATTGPETAASARDRLIERTMAAVRAAEAAEARVLRIEQASEHAGSRFRLSDLVSLAAMLLIVASVALPAMQGVAHHREQAACLTNMQTAARAFGSYAGANADMLPMATAGFGGSWMDVGTPNRSNSANLYTLPREGYARLDDFACPTNAHAPRGAPEPGSMDWRSMDEISYSYRIMGGGGLRMTVAVPSAAQVVMIADRSPVTLRASRGEVVYPEANSPNHAARGQHLLRMDGSSTWEKTPVVDGDNIWLPRQAEEVIRHVRTRMGIIRGDEMPASPTDAFVGP